MQRLDKLQYMIEFYWPYFIILLPIPLIYNYTRSKQPDNSINSGLKIPYYNELVTAYNKSSVTSDSQYITKLLKTLIWIFFIIALIRPVHLGDPISLPIPAHDIIMAIDISGSMQSDDMSERYRQTRLDVVKKIAHEFIDKRTTDRIGLVFFGSNAFLSSPLTLDKLSLHSFLDKTQIGFAGQKTAIGDSLGLAIKRLKHGNTSDNTKFIILLSDGSNTSGQVEPLDAAKVAGKNNIKIYTIGIGKKNSSFFDMAAGMDLDEKTLKSIANSTNGRYFHAENMRALQEIYDKIDKLEPVNKDQKLFRPETEFYIYPLIISLLLLLILSIKSFRHD